MLASHTILLLRAAVSDVFERLHALLGFRLVEHPFKIEKVLYGLNPARVTF